MLDNCLERLYNGAALIHIRRLLAATPLVVVALCGLLVSYSVLFDLANLDFYSIRSSLIYFGLFPVGLFWVFQSSEPLSYGSKSRARLFFERVIHRGFGWDFSHNETEVFANTIFVVVSVYTVLYAVVGTLSLVQGQILKGVAEVAGYPFLIACAFAWGPVTLLAVSQDWLGDGIHLRAIAIVLLKIRAAVWRRLRGFGWAWLRLLAVGLLVQAVAVGFIFGIVFLLDHFAGLTGHLIVVIGGVLILAIVPIIVVVALGREMRSRWRVRKMVSSTDLNGSVFLEALCNLATPQDVAQYLRAVRLRRNDEIRVIPRAIVRDLERLIEDLPQDGRDLSAGAVGSTVAQVCFDGKLTSSILASWRGEVLDELGRIEEDLRER